jgi:hypothetical protein
VVFTLLILNGNLITDFTCNNPGVLEVSDTVNPKLISYYPRVTNAAAGGSLENEVNRALATLVGGSTHANDQYKKWDNFQRLKGSDPYPLGLRASAATSNLLAGLAAASQNTSFEVTAANDGDWVVANGATAIVATDRFHGVNSCQFTSDGVANGGITIDATAATANAQYTATAMVKASTGMVGESAFIRLTGDVSGNTDGAAVVLTGDWQLVTCTKTYAGDSARSMSVFIAAPENGDMVLIDCCQLVAGAAPLPFTTQDAAAASATIPTPVTAGASFTALILARRPTALLGSTTYEFFNAVASNAGFRLRMENNTLRWERMNGTAGNGVLISSNIGADTFLAIALSSDNNCGMRMAVNGTLATAGCTPYGSGDDQFNYPRGIACDDTYLYVADTSNNRIVKRNLDLTYDSKIGSYGSGDDQFNYPYGIACDGTYLYVADTSNHRIVKRELNLVYVSESPRATTTETSLPASLSLPSSQNDILLLFVWDGYAAGDAELQYLSCLNAPPPRDRMWY